MAHRGTIALILGVSVLTSSMVSTVAFTHDRFSRTPARNFVETAREQLALAPDGLQLYDQQVPPSLLSGLFGSASLASQVLAPVTPERLAGSSTAPSAENPQVFDDSGRLRRIGVAGVQLRTGPVPGCGWQVQGARRTLPWSQPVSPFGGAVRIGYLSAGAVDATFQQGETTVTARLHPGLGQVIFRTTGAADALTVTVPGSGIVCIGDAQVGDVVVLP